MAEAFKRAAESLEKLLYVTRQELPHTMAAVRLSGMEISDLTIELSDLGQEITQGVKSSTRAVRLAEERLRRLTNMNPSALIALFREGGSIVELSSSSSSISSSDIFDIHCIANNPTLDQIFGVLECFSPPSSWSKLKLQIFIASNTFMAFAGFGTLIHKTLQKTSIKSTTIMHLKARYFKPLVPDVEVVAKCHLSVLYRHEKGKLVAQLLALANIGAIHKRADLSKKLYVLSPDELRDLVCNKLKLVLKNDPWTKRVDFLNEAMSTSRCHVSVATCIFLLELADKDYQLRGLLG
ncbi:hypothetical protein Tco_0556692 [Tanacetum coccineum]